jgi:hypothetical protein
MPGKRLPLSGHFVYICSRIKRTDGAYGQITFGVCLPWFRIGCFSSGQSGADAYQWKGDLPFGIRA